MATERTLVAVLRSGGDYRPEHAARLFANARFWSFVEEIPLRCVLLTDQPHPELYPDCEVRQLWHRWPGWWSKLELFDAAQDDLGDFLFVDLDTIFVGRLAPLFRHGAERPVCNDDFYRPGNLQSSMMWLPQHARATVSSAWREDPHGHMHHFPGDGNFVDFMYKGKADTWQALIPGAIVSYKKDMCAQPKVPTGAHVVCFHGRPRPWDTPLWPGALRF